MTDGLKRHRSREEREIRGGIRRRNEDISPSFDMNFKLMARLRNGSGARCPRDKEYNKRRTIAEISGGKEAARTSGIFKIFPITITSLFFFFFFIKGTIGIRYGSSSEMLALTDKLVIIKAKIVAEHFRRQRIMEPTIGN